MQNHVMQTAREMPRGLMERLPDTAPFDNILIFLYSLTETHLSWRPAEGQP